MPDRLSKAKVQEVEAMVYEGGRTYVEIAALSGLAPPTVRQIANGEHGHQNPSRRANYCPTLEEIADACVKIRRRNGSKRPRCEVPQISLCR